MKNLKNLKVVELNAQETRKIEGGIIGIDDVLLLGLGALIGVALSQDIDRLKAAYKAGYAAGSK